MTVSISPSRLKVQGRWLSPALSSLATAVLLFLVGLPILAIVAFAIFPQLNEGSLAAPFSIFWPSLKNPALVRTTFNSLALATSVTLLSVIIALPLAILRRRLSASSARAWDAVLLVPFLIPPYIGAMAWMQLLQVKGFIEQLFGFNLAPQLYSFYGLVAVMALHLFPMIYVAASAALNLIGQRYEEVAVVFGAKRRALFWRIQLPLLSISLLASGLIVFTLTLEEYGTPEILGSRFGFEVLVTSIAAKFSDWPIDLPGASVLSLILIALALIAFNVQRKLANHFGSAIDQPKMQTVATQTSLTGRLMAQMAFALIAILAVGLPLASVASSAFTATLSGGLTWQNLSTRHMLAILQPDSPAWAALRTSLTLALLAALCSVVIAVLVAFVLVRLRAKGAALLDFLALLPNALPGMTIAVGLILTWNQSFWPITPYNHAAILLIAYVCLTLPYPIRTITATLRQLPSSLDEAGYISGANELRVIVKLLLPLLAPSALASGLIVFAISTRELVSSLMLAPPGIETVATYVFHQFDQGSINAGMAMSLITILLSGSIMAFGQHLQRRPTV